MFKGSEEIPAGFDSPTALPKSPEEARAWQEANRTWWEKHPMRYDFFQELESQQEFSREMYEEIDRRFLALSEEYLYNRKRPFDQLIPAFLASYWVNANVSWSRAAAPNRAQYAVFTASL